MAKAIKNVRSIPRIPVVAEKRRPWPVIAPKPEMAEGRRKKKRKPAKRKKRKRDPEAALRKLAAMGITSPPPSRKARARKPVTKGRVLGKMGFAGEGTVGNRMPVTSSNVASIGYDGGQQLLEVEFHSGAVYQYHEVPKRVWGQFKSAPSKGKFVWRKLRRYGADDAFAYERIV